MSHCKLVDLCCYLPERDGVRDQSLESMYDSSQEPLRMDILLVVCCGHYHNLLLIQGCHSQSLELSGRIITLTFFSVQRKVARVLTHLFQTVEVDKCRWILEGLASRMARRNLMVRQPGEWWW